MIKLNTGRLGSPFPENYYPRLQVNKRGEIVLSTSKGKTFTTGVLVGKTPESTSKVPIGQKLTDWEVAGDLTDYDGPITATFQNQSIYE